MGTSFNTPPPFAKATEESKTVEEVETVEEEIVEEEPKTKKGEKMTAPEEAKEEKKTIKPKNKTQITKEHIDYVRQNVKKMGYGEMADALDITKNQINRILQTLKEGLRGKAVDQDDNAYGTKKNKKGDTIYDWSEPKSDLAKKVEKKISDELSRPAESRPGGGGGGKVKQALDSALDDLLADL